MSLKSLKIFKNNQTGLIWKLEFQAFIDQVRSTSKSRQNKRNKSFNTSF